MTPQEQQAIYESLTQIADRKSHKATYIYFIVTLIFVFIILFILNLLIGNLPVGVICASFIVPLFIGIGYSRGTKELSVNKQQYIEMFKTGNYMYKHECVDKIKPNLSIIGTMVKVVSYSGQTYKDTQFINNNLGPLDIKTGMHFYRIDFGIPGSKPVCFIINQQQ